MKEILLIVLLIPAIATAEIYKSLDKDGNIVFTDIQPNEDAKAVELLELNISESPTKKRSSRNLHPQNRGHLKPSVAQKYHSIKVTKPGNDTTIRNNDGSVVVSVDLQPALAHRHGDRLIIEMDGRRINPGGRSTVSLKDLDRGSHTIVARVETELPQTEPTITTSIFHLKRPTIKN